MAPVVLKFKTTYGGSKTETRPATVKVLLRRLRGDEIAHCVPRITHRTGNILNRNILQYYITSFFPSSFVSYGMEMFSTI